MLGTSYTIYEDKENEVSLDEMSNLLQLSILDKTKEEFMSTKDLEPKVILQTFMKGITSISYWMSEEEFNSIFSNLEIYPFK